MLFCLDGLHCIFGQLIFGKSEIITSVATRGQILRLKCTKFYGAPLHPRPHWGSLQCKWLDLAGFKGPTSKKREGRGRERKGRGRKGRGGREGNIAFHHLLLSNLTTEFNPSFWLLEYESVIMICAQNEVTIHDGSRSRCSGTAGSFEASYHCDNHQCVQFAVFCCLLIIIITCCFSFVQNS